MKILNKIFSISPVGQRPQVNSLIKKVFSEFYFKESDDTYIYYQGMRAAFFLVLVLLALNWVSYLYQIQFDLFFFVIDLPQTGFIEAFAWSFPFYTSTFILTIIVPFYLVKMRWNMVPKNVDFLWWNKRLMQATRMNKRKMIFYYLFALSLLIFAMYGGYGWPTLLSRYYIFSQNLEFLFFLTTILYMVSYPLFSFGLLMIFCVLWRYSTARKINLSLYPIRGGHNEILK